MATTRLTDVIYGPTFLPTVMNKTWMGSMLTQSGIVSQDAELQRFANSLGDILQMPFWNDISGASNVSSDDPAQNATPNKIDMGQDFARKIRRNNGWQAANLVASVMTEDPLDVIAQLIANYWIREESTVLSFILNGIFAAASMAGNVLNVATEAGNTAGVKLDADVSANAHALLGDAGITLRAAMMHSRVFWNLEALGQITYSNRTGQLVNPVNMGPNDPNFAMPFWHGKRVIVNDNVPRVAGATNGFKYTSYFFADGALGYAEATGDGGPKKPVELDTAPSSGNGEGVDTVWYRRHWIMHPRGVKFTSTTVAGASPTNAELALAANWVRVYDPKNVRIVAVVTNG